MPAPLTSLRRCPQVRYSSKQAAELPPAKLTPHPAAAACPGAVPAAAPAAGPVTVLVNPRFPGRASNYIYADPGADLWVSTGVYARPGGAVTVALPSAAAKLGLKVSIGCHIDSLWGKESLRRMPEIVRVYPLTKASTTAASAFGGLVYIRVPVVSARRWIIKFHFWYYHRSILVLVLATAPCQHHYPPAEPPRRRPPCAPRTPPGSTRTGR